MRFFQLGIRQKMLLILGLSAVTLAGFCWFMLQVDYRLMQSERELKLRDITDNAITIAASLQKDVQAGHMTKAEAIGRLHDLLDTMRFGASKDYSYAYTTEGVSVANAGNPAL